MSDDTITRGLALLEQPVDPDSDFADRLRLRFLAEAEAEADVAVEPTRRAPRRVALRSPLANAWRPAVAVAVLALLVMTIVVVVPSGLSPVSALQTARERFLDLPSYRATTRVAANDSQDDPDFEQVWETEDVFRDRTHWRSTVLSSSDAPMGAGDFRVFDGDLLGEYRAAADIFVITPAADLDTLVGIDPSFFFDPSLQWWGTGRPGDTGKPSDAFFAENCEAAADTHLGRAVTVLTCDAEPSDLELVLDDQTGMLLRIEWFDIVREITAIEFTDDLDDDLLEVAPPDGARVHWDGSGEPPAEFAVEPDGSIAVRWDVISQVARPPGAELAGLTIDAVTEGTVWLSAIWCGTTDGCRHQILAVDDATGEVTVIEPPTTSFVLDVGFADDLAWVALAEQPSDRLVIREIDRSAGALSETLHDLGSAFGGAVAVGDWIWAVGGSTRVVEIGPAQSTYASLVAVDLSTGSRLTVSVDDAGFTSTPVVVDDTLWAVTDAIDPTDPYESLGAVVAVDPQSGEILTQIALPFVPAARPAAMNSALYFVHYQGGWFLSRLDLGDQSLTTVRLADAGTELGHPVVAGGHVWITDFLGDQVLRVDPSTLEVVDTVVTGRGPSGLALSDTGLWAVNALDGTLVRIALP